MTDIDIARNVIEDNAKLNLPPEGFVNFDVAVGGVCLAASTNAWIHEATAIRTKAKSTSGEMPTFPTGNGSEIPPEGEKDWTGATSQSAVTVRGNEVVQLFGRALWVARGFGPIVVTGNTLLSYGSMVLDPVPGASLRWLYKDLTAETSGSLVFGAAGACVEISNYGLPEDKPWSETPGSFPALSFVDPGQDEIYGGGLLVTGNRMRLEWERHGGWPASVLVQSIGAVVFNDNASEVAMGNDFSTPTDDPEKEWAFATEACGQSFAYTFMLTNVFVGGKGSVSLVGNRLTEARWDTIFSALLGVPAAPVDKDLVTPSAASLAVTNVGSHCIVAPNAGPAIKADNIEVYPIKRVASSTYTCQHIEVVTDGVSGVTRLVGAEIEITAPAVP